MAKTQYGMVIDARSCLDCKACVVACKAENGVPPGASRDWVHHTLEGVFPELRAVIEPGQCNHCSEAPCVDVCPTGASHFAEGGMVQITREECIGCQLCMEACPYGARYYDEQAEKVDKCSFCRHRVEQGLEPACVVTCPTKVRVFGDLNDPSSAAARLLATRRTVVPKPEAQTRPNNHYIVD
ncbi:MAG: 4Fe-4S dicluster domain-containing protein [Acidobacteriota bacterium]|nr:4Fe-4S dicluster domain-containing protein [Acidobacteriota bacterium]